MNFQFLIFSQNRFTSQIKLRLLGLFIVILVLVFSPGVASAHVLQSDGNIGAVMHIDPNDSPVANQPATFYFEIKDKTNKFDPKNCNCRVDIYENGKVVYSDALYQSTGQNSLSAPVFQYIFPQKDVYNVKLIGSPVNPGDFQPFTISYEVRVDQSAGNTQSNQQNPLTSHLFQIIIAGVAIIVLILFAVINERNKKK